MSYKETGTCCFCGKKYTHYGNSIDPLIHPSGIDARCCDVCNATIVIPNRLVFRSKMIFVIYNKDNASYCCDDSNICNKVLFTTDITKALMFDDMCEATTTLEDIKKQIKLNKSCCDINSIIIKRYYLNEVR